MTWAIRLLRNRLTWRVLIAAASLLGISLRPDVWEGIASVGIAIAGLLEVGFHHAENRTTPLLPPDTADIDSRLGAALDAVDADVGSDDRAVPDADELRHDVLSHGRPGPGPTDRNPSAGWNG